jgi:hypothetical protein
MRGTLTAREESIAISIFGRKQERKRKEMREKGKVLLVIMG